MQSTDQHTNKFMQESKKKKRLIQHTCQSFIQVRLVARSTLKAGPATDATCNEPVAAMTSQGHMAARAMMGGI